jgi:multidrug resistance protein
LRRLSVLIAANGVDMIGFAMVLPLLPFYALELRATPEVIGWIIASFSIAQLVSAPLWGRLSDRYGRRPALLIGLSGSAAAYVVFGLADSVWLLFLSRIVQGAGGGTTGVAHAYVADTVAPQNRARALGWLSAATAAGVMLGPVIGSLASHWGRAAPGFVAAFLCIINVVFAWKWLPESRVLGTGEQRASGHDSVWRVAWKVVRHPQEPVSVLIWIYAVGMLAFTGLTGVLALYLGARFGVTEKTIGFFFLYVGGLSLVVRSLLLGPMVRRLGEVGAIRAGAMLLVTGLALYPAAPNLWALAVVIPFVPVGTALLFPATTSLLSARASQAEVGTVMGIAQTFAGIARVIAPVAATSLFQRAGRDVPFYAAAATVALVSLASFRLRPGPPETQGFQVR